MIPMAHAEHTVQSRKRALPQVLDCCLFFFCLGSGLEQRFEIAQGSERLTRREGRNRQRCGQGKPSRTEIGKVSAGGDECCNQAFGRRLARVLQRLGYLSESRAELRKAF